MNGVVILFGNTVGFCMSGKRRTFGEFRDFWGADRSGEKDLACGMLIHSNAMNRKEVDAWSKEYSFCY